MIQIASAHGMKVMIEISVSIMAPAHISPLVDWAELDGNPVIGMIHYEGERGNCVAGSRTIGH